MKKLLSFLVCVGLVFIARADVNLSGVHLKSDLNAGGFKLTNVLSVLDPSGNPITGGGGSASNAVVTLTSAAGYYTYTTNGTGQITATWVSTNAVAGAFNASGSNSVTLQATAAAQANNLVTPTGGVMTNVGSVLVTNGSIVVLYGQTIGHHTYTLLDASGAITTGGSMGINSAFVGYQQIPMYSSAMLNIQQDTFGGIQLFGNSGLYPIFAVAEPYVVGGNTTTNGDWPLGATWMDLDSQGGVLYRRSFTAAELGTVATGNNDFTTLETAFETSVNPDVWGPTNVYQWQALTNGTVVYGPLLSAVPTRSSGTPIRWTGTVQPALTTSTNATWLGNGGVLVSNIYSGTTNVIVGVDGIFGSTKNYTNNGAEYFNSGSSWISNNSTVWIWKDGVTSPGLFTNTSLLGNTWTNKNGWTGGSNTTAYVIYTTQSPYVFSNAAPRVIINNPIVIGTAYSNSLNVKLEGRATFFLTSSAVSGFPGLTYSNFTTGVTETITNGIVLAGTESRNFFFSVYPAEVIGFYQGSSGSATATMQTNNLSYP